MAQQRLIYAGIKGSVIALDVSTGVQVWAVKLKGSDFVNIALLDRVVIAATSGEVFCLDAQSGDLLWNNPLKGYGLGIVSLAGEGMTGGQSATGAQKRKQDEAASAGQGASSANF